MTASFVDLQRNIREKKCVRSSQFAIELKGRNRIEIFYPIIH